VDARPRSSQAARLRRPARRLTVVRPTAKVAQPHHPVPCEGGWVRRVYQQAEAVHSPESALRFQCVARALLPRPGQRVPAAPHQGALAAVGPRMNAATASRSSSSNGASGRSRGSRPRRSVPVEPLASTPRQRGRATAPRRTLVAPPSREASRQGPPCSGTSRGSAPRVRLARASQSHQPSRCPWVTAMTRNGPPCVSNALRMTASRSRLHTPLTSGHQRRPQLRRSRWMIRPHPAQSFPSPPTDSGRIWAMTSPVRRKAARCSSVHVGTTRGRPRLDRFGASSANSRSCATSASRLTGALP
jgi:hypothetical protein